MSDVRNDSLLEIALMLMESKRKPARSSRYCNGVSRQSGWFSVLYNGYKRMLLPRVI